MYRDLFAAESDTTLVTSDMHVQDHELFILSHPSHASSTLTLQILHSDVADLTDQFLSFEPIVPFVSRHLGISSRRFVEPPSRDVGGFLLSKCSALRWPGGGHEWISGE